MVVAVVPARRGSKGFPGKNVATIGGRTLLDLAVGVGLDCPSIDDVYVSTDSPEYEEIAVAANAKSVGLRPAVLAGDEARTADVLVDLLPRLPRNYDIVVLLQPTSPVRTVADIETCISMLADDSDVDAVISVSRLDAPHPHKLGVINERGRLVPYFSGAIPETPRQMLPAVYQPTGAVYAIRTKTLLETRTFHPAKTFPYVTEPVVNIDTEIDFILLESLYANKMVSVHGL